MEERSCLRGTSVLAGGAIDKWSPMGLGMCLLVGKGVDNNH